MIIKNILSIMALIAIVGLVYIDLNFQDTDVQWFVYGGLLGIVYQANPSDILQVIKERL
jgi:hypothetical protein